MKPGDIVRFVENSPVTWGVPAKNARSLLYWHKYTVDRVEVRSSHTKVFLKEHPDMPFNEVWFKVIDEDKT